MWIKQLKELNQIVIQNHQKGSNLFLLYDRNLFIQADQIIRNKTQGQIIKRVYKMGQNEVKIPTADHLLVFRLSKYNHLQIQVYLTYSKHDMELEYCQSYSYQELSQQVREQFHSIKSLFTAIDQSAGLCCTGSGHGKLRIEFQQGKVIMQKHIHGKQLIIKIHKVNQQHSSDKMSEQLKSKLVSLQDRLQKQVESQKISHQQNTDMTKQKSIKATYKNSNDQYVKSDKNNNSSIIKNNVLIQGKDYFRTKNGVYLNLFNHNNLRKQTTQKEIIDSIKFSILSPMIVISLDLTGNKITTTGLKTLLKMNWKCLKKLWLDDNLIEDLTGLEQMNNLIYLGLSNNLLNKLAAQKLSLCKFNKLQYLKISFIKSDLQPQMCINLMWSDEGQNLPSLKKLIILNHRPLPQSLIKKFEQWKDSDTILDRDYVIETKQELQKFMTRKKSYIGKLNHIDDYPELY